MTTGVGGAEAKALKEICVALETLPMVNNQEIGKKSIRCIVEIAGGIGT